MAYKPEIISLNDFVKMQREAFTPYELWLTDELTNYLVAKRDLDESYTSIVIDLDIDEPIYGLKDNNIQLRFNGRFYLPVEDRNIKPINIGPKQWVELFKKWFDDEKLEVVIDETATDFIKFTALIPVIEIPEMEKSTEEDAKEEGGGSEETEETEAIEESPEEKPEETPSEETEPETEVETEEKESPVENEGQEDQELKEFEKALGL